MTSTRIAQWRMARRSLCVCLPNLLLFMLDVLISIAVLIVVALTAESGNPGLAAVAASAPTGVPLSLYLVWSRAPPAADHTKVLTAYTGALVRGVYATLAFALVARLCATRGYGLGSILAAAYLAWAAAWWALNRTGLVALV